MSARYLIRFDDICPTMNWGVWELIEEQLDFYGIKPILAVIPDNQDPKLCVQRPNEAFWGRVREWQRKGWAIGIHGYQHKYETSDGGLLGLNKQSEFAGLPKEIQETKIKQAVEIFNREGIHSHLWVAPAHSFDENTLAVLKANELNVISDGMYTRPVKDKNKCVWMPQQLWRFYRLPFGLWTVCYHHNLWNEMDINIFKRDLACYRGSIVSVNDILHEDNIPDCNFFDKIVFKLLLAAVKSRSRYRRLLKL